MKKPLIPVVALLLVGCAQPALAPAVDDNGVTAYLSLDVRDTADRHVLAPSPLSPWLKSNIDHARLYLLKASDDSLLASKDVTKAQIDGQVAFGNLKRSTDYKVVARAWSGTDEVTTEIDNYENVASSCVTSFSTGTAESVAISNIKLTLRNKTFSGTTTDAAINVVDGAVVDTSATETVNIKSVPTLTSVYPMMSQFMQPAATVTITGSGFTGATAVRYGTTNATSFVVLSDTQIQATLQNPMMLPGTYYLYVVTPVGTNAAGVQFTWM